MRVLRGIFQALLQQLGFTSSRKPSLITLREREDSKAAIVFIHGFGGDTTGTWGRFPEFIKTEPKLNGWDVFAVGYPSSLRVDVVGIWEADPDLDIASLSLRTAISVLPLCRYRSLAIIAHSMGGLIAQRAVIDQEVMAGIGHLILFGCPSAGLTKASVGADLKRQSRDMSVGSSFIESLRSDWSARFKERIPFSLRVVAGERDEFVPASSSLSPFPSEYQRVVPGNHLEIVKPQAALDRSVQVVVDSLLNKLTAVTMIDSALIAVELRDFSRAVAVLLPRADQIDDEALVQLALALDGLGRGQEALSLLEGQFARRGRSSSDAMGVLAGRLKRRWLIERLLGDWERSRSLYFEALRIADPTVPGSDAAMSSTEQKPFSEGAVIIDPDQAMYHAINVAFLDLMKRPQASQVPLEVRAMAQRALLYAQSAKDNHWRHATQGDAYCILGDLKRACEAYSLAVLVANSPREIDSMYSQAIRLAGHTFATPGIEAVESAFGVGKNAAPGSAAIAESNG